MKQTLFNIIKDNFPLLLEKFENKPFMILTIIFITVSGIFFKKWYNVTEELNKREIACLKEKDSLSNKIIKLEMDVHNSKKYQDINNVADSVLKTLIINNLIKNSSK